MDKGISFRLITRDGTIRETRVLLKLSLKSIDMVFQFDPIHMYPGDLLTVSVDLNLAGRTDGELTSLRTERWSYTHCVKNEAESVSFCRFTKHGDRAWIIPLQQEPFWESFGDHFSATKTG